MKILLKNIENIENQFVCYIPINQLSIELLTEYVNNRLHVNNSQKIVLYYQNLILEEKSVYYFKEHNIDFVFRIVESKIWNSQVKLLKHSYFYHGPASDPLLTQNNSTIDISNYQFTEAPQKPVNNSHKKNIESQNKLQSRVDFWKKFQEEQNITESLTIQVPPTDNLEELLILLLNQLKEKEIFSIEFLKLMKLIQENLNFKVTPEKVLKCLSRFIQNKLIHSIQEHRGIRTIFLLPNLLAQEEINKLLEFASSAHSFTLSKLQCFNSQWELETIQETLDYLEKHKVLIKRFSLGRDIYFYP